MILSGGEPFYFPGGPVGCLLIHGFLSTPGEMRTLGEKLSSAGFSVLGVRLAGHARHPRDLKRVRWEDWIASVEDGFQWLNESCKRVVLIGMSLGGAIGLACADLLGAHGVVAISTPFDLIPHRRFRFLAKAVGALRFLSPLIRYFPKLPAWDYVDTGAAKAHLTYSYFPSTSLIEIKRVFRQMWDRLPNLTGPILLIHSRADRGVPFYNLTEIEAGLSTPELTIMDVENSGHVILLEPEANRVEARIIDFVSQFS